MNTTFKTPGRRLRVATCNQNRFDLHSPRRSAFHRRRPGLTANDGGDLAGPTNGGFMGFDWRPCIVTPQPLRAPSTNPAQES